MARPSNASLHVPSERDFQNPLDFPNSLVCILEAAVSKGCKIETDITEDCAPNKESMSFDSTFNQLECSFFLLQIYRTINLREHTELVDHVPVLEGEEVVS